MALAERLRISPGVPLLLAAFVWLASPLLLGGYPVGGGVP